MTLEHAPQTTESAVSDAERAELRHSVRSFLDKNAPESQLVHWLETEPGYDGAALRGLHDQLALNAIRIPERFGGMGYGWRELGVALEEAGRALLGMPYLSGQLAVTALLESGTHQACSKILPGIATGETVVTVAGTSVGSDTDLHAVRSDPAGQSWLLDGAARYILDGSRADLLLLLATTPDGPALFGVDRSSAGVRREPLVTMDLTRPLAHLHLSGAPARLLSDGPCTSSELARVRASTSLALAAEQIGGARRALEITADHVRNRVQFGRTIGSFQAIKHRCADLLVSLRESEAAYSEALLAADSDPDEVLILAHLAAASCSETYLEIARAMIQLHGGIGITWEHIAHLHLKRAKSSQHLFGSPAAHRRIVAEQVGLIEV